VNTFPVVNVVAVAAGGYPAACAALTSASPSSPPVAIVTVNVPELACATTVPVCAEVADAEPAEFDAVTTTCTVDPTSAPDNRYVLAFEPTFTQPGEHRCH
jgi:hypothetical protein